MKKSKQTKAASKPSKSGAPILKTPASRTFSWEIPVLAGAALIVAFLIYAPALNGPFLFDDRYLPFLQMHLIGRPFAAWLIGLRPFVNLSFWLNSGISGSATWSYHALNI